MQWWTCFSVLFAATLCTGQSNAHAEMCEKLHEDCVICESFSAGTESLNVADFDQNIANVANCLDRLIFGVPRTFPDGTKALTEDISVAVHNDAWRYSPVEQASGECVQEPCFDRFDKLQRMFELIFGEAAERAPGLAPNDQARLSCTALCGDATRVVEELTRLGADD